MTAFAYDAPLHVHDWRIVAVEEDSFGLVRMLQCLCGAVEYRSAPGTR